MEARPRLAPRIDAGLALEWILLAVLYFGAARLSLLLSFAETNASPVWPPSGIAAAWVLLRGRKMLPGVWLGSLMANDVTFLANHATGAGNALLISAFIATGNSLEGLFFGQRRYYNLFATPALGGPATISRLLLLEAPLACAVAATCGVLTLSQFHIIPGHLAGTVWKTWFFGDVVGVYLFLPWIAAWKHWFETPKQSNRQWVALAIFIATLLGSWFGFESAVNAPGVFSVGFFPPIAAVAVVLMLDAWLLPLRHASTCVLVVAGVGIWKVVNDQGALGSLQTNRGLLWIDILLGAVAAAAVFLTALRGNRGDAAEQYLKAQAAPLSPGLPLLAGGLVLAVAVASWRVLLAHPSLESVFQLPTLVLGTGSLLAALFGLSLFLAVNLSRRTQEHLLAIQALEKSNRELDRERDRAEAAGRAKSEFLANMSHEIRTPLNGIYGMISLLETTRTDTDQQEYLRDARISCESLNGLVSDVLDLSKIEAGRFSLETSEFDIRLNAWEALEIVSEKCFSKDLSVSISMDPMVPDKGCSDAVRIRQVLLNLLSNAAKFTSEGEVALRVKLLKSDDASFFLRYEVADTGMGISDDVQEKLFQPFSQGDASTTRKFGGAGLGLSISRRLVAMLQGDIGIESRPEQGALFWFTARIGKALTQSEAPSANPAFPRDVWVIENRSMAREALRRTLEGAGASVRVFSDCRALPTQDGMEAVPDLVLCAHRAGQNAIESLHRLRGRKGWRNVHLVLMGPTAVRRKTAQDRKASDIGFVPLPLKPDFQQTGFLHIDAPRNGVRPPSDRFDGIRILLAEDNPVNQKVAVSYFRMLGCAVDVAKNGQEALELHLNSTYDIIFMDLHMPLLDGIQATRAIRELEGSKSKIPIVAVTADVMFGNRERCLAAGMNEYLSKPVHFPELARTLGEWCKPAVT